MLRISAERYRELLSPQLEKIIERRRVRAADINWLAGHLRFVLDELVELESKTKKKK